MNNVSDIAADQLELGFNRRRAHGAHATRPLSPRQRRVQRAQWWFKQMRRVVDQTMDWNSTPPARPEQVYLTLAKRN